MANNATYPLGPSAPSVRLNGTAVTPGMIDYNPPLTKLFVETGGTLVATMPQTGTVTMVVPANFTLDDVAILNVGTATTATGITGFW